MGKLFKLTKPAAPTFYCVEHAPGLSDGELLNIFATNRNLEEAATVHINLIDKSIAALDSAEILTGPGSKAINLFEQPNLIQARPFQAVEINEGMATIILITDH